MTEQIDTTAEGRTPLPAGGRTEPTTPAGWHPSLAFRVLVVLALIGAALGQGYAWGANSVNRQWEAAQRAAELGISAGLSLEPPTTIP